MDDGFALAAILCAHRAGSARLQGVSTVSGNTSAERAGICAAKLCGAAGVEIPVAHGAAAVEGLTLLSEETELLALGPLTNLARACRSHPGLPARVSLRVVGGNLSSPGFLPPLWPFEFNLARDPASAREVFAASWRRLVLYPLDVVRRIRADRHRLAEIARLSSLGGYLARESRRWLLRARRLRLSRSFPLWDLPAALDALGLPFHGRTVTEARPGPSIYFGNEPRVQAVTSLDPTEYWGAFETLLASSEMPPDRSQG